MATANVPAIDEREFESSADTFQLLDDEIKKLQADCNNFSFLAAGKTGAGKSTLLNALTDSSVFNSSSDRHAAGTTIISKYQFERNGVTITAWDSPGFQDSSGNEEQYKKELRENCSDVDLLMYCISLKDVRSDLGNDASALKQITEALSKEVWRKSVIVLTFANMCSSRLEMDRVPNVKVAFKEKIAQWKLKVQEALLVAGVDESVIAKLPVIAAGHYKKRDLPGQKFWLSHLWLQMYNSVHDDAKLALQVANRDRFIAPENAENSSLFSLVMTRENIITAAVGGTVTATGAAVGATTGALIGALAIGIPTFGVAAGVGLVLGLVVGGGIGGGTAGGVALLVRKIRDRRRKKREENSAATDLETST